MHSFIIAGSRDFTDLELLTKVMSTLVDVEDISIQLISGMARGADMTGVKWAEENGIYIKEFHANWSKYGKSAGFKRNAEMLKHADGVIAFWDGASRGTKHMIKIAQDADIPVHIHLFNQD